jgi:hypothetical protein
MAISATPATKTTSGPPSNPKVQPSYREVDVGTAPKAAWVVDGGGGDVVAGATVVADAALALDSTAAGQIQPAQRLTPGVRYWGVSIRNWSQLIY